MKCLSLVLLPLILCLGSCSVQAKLTLAESGSAEVSALFLLKGPTKDVWKNLRDLDPTLPEDPFDPSVWKQGLGPDAKIGTTPAGTSVWFPVPNPAKVLPGLKVSEGSWDVTLDRTSVRKLAALTAWSGSPALESLIPAADTKVTEAEYTDLLVYLLGNGLTEAAAKALVAGSTVELTVEAPRPLKWAEGAASLSGRTAVYRWPLVKILTLSAPIRFRLTF